MTNPTNPEPAVLTAEIANCLSRCVHPFKPCACSVCKSLAALASGLTICKPAAAEREMQEKIADLEKQVVGYQQECIDVEQALGKALHYPWYKDDQKNFPGSSEKDGVCVGGACARNDCHGGG